MQKTLLKIIETEINPYVNEWEKEGQYPAHQVLNPSDYGFNFYIFTFWHDIFNITDLEMCN